MATVIVQMSGMVLVFILFYFIYPYQGHLFIILEREEGKEQERERETSIQERSIDQLPPVCSQTRHRMHMDPGSNLQLRYVL